MAKIVAYAPNGQAYQCDSMKEAKLVQGGFKFKKRKNGGSRAANAFAAAVLQKAKSYEGTHDPAFWKAYELLVPHGQGDRPDRDRIVYFFDHDLSYKQGWATDKNLRTLTGHSYKTWYDLWNKGEPLRKRKNGGCGCGGACGNPHCGPKRNPDDAGLHKRLVEQDYNESKYNLSHGDVAAEKGDKHIAAMHYARAIAAGALSSREGGYLNDHALARRGAGVMGEAQRKVEALALGKRNPDPRYVPVSNPRKRNPSRSAKHMAHEREEEKIFASMLAKLPIGKTVKAGPHRVRKLSKGYAVVDGERLSMADAAAKLHGRG